LEKLLVTLFFLHVLLYGLGLSPIPCRLLLFNETLPLKKWMHIGFISEHFEKEKYVQAKIVINVLNSTDGTMN
jgi:hypothetical protein